MEKNKLLGRSAYNHSEDSAPRFYVNKVKSALFLERPRKILALWSLLSWHIWYIRREEKKVSKLSQVLHIRSEKMLPQEGNCKWDLCKPTRVRNCLLLSSADSDRNSKSLHRSSKVNFNTEPPWSPNPASLPVARLSLHFLHCQELHSVLLFSLPAPRSTLTTGHPVVWGLVNFLANFQDISQGPALSTWVFCMTSASPRYELCPPFHLF